MEFRAEPEYFRAEDGKRYASRKEAEVASMKWTLGQALLHTYKYRCISSAMDNAKFLYELWKDGLLRINWARVKARAHGKTKPKKREEL